MPEASNGTNTPVIGGDPESHTTVEIISPSETVSSVCLKNIPNNNLFLIETNLEEGSSCFLCSLG